MHWGFFALILMRNLCPLGDNGEPLMVGVLNIAVEGERQALCWRDELFPLVNFTESITDGLLFYEFTEQHSFTVERASGLIVFKQPDAKQRYCSMDLHLKPLRQRSRQLDRMLPLLEPAP